MAIALFSEKNFSFNLIYFDWLIKKDSTILSIFMWREFLNTDTNFSPLSSYLENK